MNESVYETPEFEEAVLKIVQKYVEEYSAESIDRLMQIFQRMPAKKEDELHADKIIQIINSNLEELIDNL